MKVLKSILIFGYIFLGVEIKADQGVNNGQKKPKVEITVLSTVCLMPGRPSIMYTIENSSDTPMRIQYSLIHSVELNLKVVNQKSGNEIPNFGGEKLLDKEVFIEIPAKSILRFVVPAPKNKIFSDPVTGVYILKHKEFDCSSAPFELDLSMTPWLIRDKISDNGKKE